MAVLHLAPPLLPIDLIDLDQPSLFLVALGINFKAKDLVILGIGKMSLEGWIDDGLGLLQVVGGL